MSKSVVAKCSEFVFPLFNAELSDPLRPDMAFLAKGMAIERPNTKSSIPGSTVFDTPDTTALSKWFNLLLYQLYLPAELNAAVARMRASKVNRKGQEVGLNGVGSINLNVQAFADRIGKWLDANADKATTKAQKAEVETQQQLRANYLLCLVNVGRKTQSSVWTSADFDLEGFADLDADDDSND